MENQTTKQKGGQLPQKTVECGKPYERVGIGPWHAEIFKERLEDGRWGYRFALDRTGCEQRPPGHGDFDTEDVLALPELSRLLATTFVQDGCLETEVRQDLQCLEDVMNWVLGDRYGADGSEETTTARSPQGVERAGPVPLMMRYRLPATLAGAIRGVLEYLYEEESDFYANPSGSHVYRHLAVLQSWLERRQVSVEAEQEAARFGGCRVCGQSDGHVNIGRSHWFVCHAHRVRWCAGEDLFSSWKSETEDDWTANHVLIADYRVVRPIY